MNLSDVLSQLNHKQKEAVTSPKGKLLVLSGAGSGKTRVLVHRIAWLLLIQHCPSHSIMAVTFTNKAATEIRLRIEKLVGTTQNDMWIGTFHGLAYRLLRLHSREMNLPYNFQIIDTEDQVHLLKRLIHTMNLNEKKWTPRQAMGYINEKKDKGLRPYHIPKNQNPIENIWQNIYYTYQIICDRSGLVDFSELLLRVYELLKRDSQILYYYRKRFTNILIDEFQDTNHIQYSWIYQLTDQNNSNIMVVGDDDQAIYSWRGAQIENIKHFLHDFSNVQIIRLEQNYRSTNNILQSANALISYNDDRMDKNLWTTRHKGELITLYCASNELDEARFIINCIKIHHDKGNNLNQNAILYRNNSQSRVLEEVLLYMNLSYCIYGGIRFFERQEIKNVLSYLRLIINHHDDIAYERIINIPPRGIGKKTINTIRNIAFQKKVSLWEASHILLLNHSCTPSIIRSLQNFVKLIYNLKKEIMELPLYMQTDFVIKNSGLWNMYQEKHENSYIRIENLKELVTATHQFQDGNNETGFFLLQKFLAHSILNENIEKSRCSTDSIQLMTLHAAKGLEFSQVFIIGLEEGLFPNHISLSNETHLKEERRLAYVGMTRAMHKLTLSYAKTRRIYGEKICHKPSRFLNEIPTVYIEKIHSLNETKIEKTKNTIQLKNVKNNNLSIGTNVYHTQFGEGIIINIRGIGDNSKLQISFKHQGIKWIMSDYIFIKRV